MTKICKKCNVDEDIIFLKAKRRGNETKNIPTEYYCPKCDHTEYEDQKMKPVIINETRRGGLDRNSLE